MARPVVQTNRNDEKGKTMNTQPTVSRQISAKLSRRRFAVYVLRFCAMLGVWGAHALVLMLLGVMYMGGRQHCYDYRYEYISSALVMVLISVGLIVFSILCWQSGASFSRSYPKWLIFFIVFAALWVTAFSLMPHNLIDPSCTGQG